MRLTDVMSAMHLAGYAEVAMLLFLCAFCAVLWQILRGHSHEHWERARSLPLDAEPAHIRRTPHGTSLSPSGEDFRS
jgi:hypothetical protein